MEVASKDHIRHILLYEFHRGSNASRAAKNIQRVYGNDIVNERTCRRWFMKFKKGNFKLIDEPRSGRPSELDDEKLEEKLAKNPDFTIRELGSEFHVSNMTIHSHLKKLGKISKGIRKRQEAKERKEAKREEEERQQQQKMNNFWILGF